jgi:NADH-quinone oxidoreductase chain G
VFLDYNNKNIEEYNKNRYYLLESKQPLIDFLFNLGIDIPHYCYHQTLSIAGNCRMCLVELKGSVKPLVSCSMSAKGSLSPKTQLFTNSPLVKKARENILEFLLLNHPLDCPICDQGGECDLQDQSLFFGFTKKRFYLLKRVVTDKNIGPVVKTIMTRCINCTRCVRFAAEIAGSEDLGVFGRGQQSEIGTYVDKTFQSELSGNIIDLCPVGALTSKSHPFIARKWELKIVNSIDCFDGFGLEIQLLIKNNRIVRIMPGFNSFDQIDNWITDKARFSFDGMFSAERKFEILHITEKKTKMKADFSWDFIFKELVYFIYFFDHLNRHASKIHKFIVIFSSHISLEVISLLHILSKKYYFFDVRRDDNKNETDNDMEANFQLNLTLIQNALALTKFCILIGVNTRFEGSYLNIKLRQRYKKGNFKLFSFGSLTDLTYSVYHIGSTLKSLKLLVEGNSLDCQELSALNNSSLTLTSSELYTRSDSKAVFELLSILKYQTTNFVANYWNSKTNVLNTTINDVGLKILNKFQMFSIKDFKKAKGIYLINTTIISIQKLLELKLLEYFYNTEKFNRVLIDQNNIWSGLTNLKKNKHYQVYSYLFLPTNVFFETSHSYVNVEGLIKKSFKSVSNIYDTKSDWQVLRNFYSYSNILYIGSIKMLNKKIQFDCNNLFNFKSFISFLHYSTENLAKLSFYLTVKNTSFGFKRTKYKSYVSKIYNTSFKRWLDDFYLGVNNIYSNYSYTMIECSATFRKALTNFILC